MFFAKGVPAVPLLDWLAVIFVEIEALFLRDVETLKDSFVKSEVLVLMNMEVVGEVVVETFMNAEAVVLGDVDKSADTVVELEVLVLRDVDTVVETETPREREFSIELNVQIIQV